MQLNEMIPAQRDEWWLYRLAEIASEDAQEPRTATKTSTEQGETTNEAHGSDCTPRNHSESAQRRTRPAILAR